MFILGSKIKPLKTPIELDISIKNNFVLCSLKYKSTVLFRLNFKVLEKSETRNIFMRLYGASCNELFPLSWKKVFKRKKTYGGLRKTAYCWLINQYDER